MRIRTVGPGLAAAFTALIAVVSDAAAEQVCLPGQGLQCGRGRVDPGAQRYVATPGRPGTALEGAAALVGIVGALLEMFDRGDTVSVPAEPPEDPHLAQIRREKADLLAQAADANRRGIEFLKAGEDRTASGYFKRAMQWADQVGDDAASRIYRKNFFNAIAQGKLKEAMRLEKLGLLLSASHQLDEADSDAERAGRSDLGRTVRDYRRQLVDRNLARPPSQREHVRAKKSCTQINGEYLCGQ